MAAKEKYLGESPLKGKPKQKMAFILKDSSVTWDKLDSKVKNAIISGKGIDVGELGFEYEVNKTPNIREYNQTETGDIYADDIKYPSERAVAKKVSNLMATINTNNTILTSKINTLTSSIETVRALITTANEHISSIEAEMESIESRIERLEEFHKDDPSPFDPKYTITFNSNGGTGYMPTVVITGSEYIVPSCSFRYDSYGFFKWAVNSPTSSETYAEGEAIENIDTNIVLYAVWKPVCTVSFDLNGGSGYVTSVSCMQGEYVNLPIYAGSKDGYRLEPNWIINNVKYLQASRYLVTENVIATPDWIMNKDITSITLEGGSIQSEIYGGEEATLTKPHVIAHYTDGTTADVSRYASCLIRVTDGSVNPSTSSGSLNRVTVTAPNILEDKDVTITVISSYVEGHPVVSEPLTLTYRAIAKHSYTITFDSNGGDGTMTSVSVEAGQNFVVPVCSFTREKNEFVKWSIGTLGSGRYLYPNDIIENVQEDYLLVAVWQAVPQPAIEYTVKFIVDDVEVYSVTGPTSTPIEIPSKPIKKGYNFVGWNTDPNAKNGITLNSRIGRRNLTYYAIFAESGVSDYYVGWTNGTKSQFRGLSNADLIEGATHYSISSNPTYTRTFGDNNIFYLLYQEGKAPAQITFTSGGIQQVLDVVNDSTCPHDDIQVNGMTYKVFGNRLVTGYDPNDSIAVTF